MFLKNLRDKKEISIEQYKDLSLSGSRPGIMYGLANVHKIVTDSLPSFRPILSVIGTPTYKLAKFLVPMLEPLTTNEYTIKDSFTFLPTLKVSSRSHINTTCCLRYYTWHLNFAQSLNVFIRKSTSLRLFLKITVTPKVLLISVSKST